MSLLELWDKSREQLRDKNIQQIIAFAGDGKLRDQNQTSKEFRAYLARVDGNVIGRYIQECLSSKFDDSGLVLQDIINQVGARLGFMVEEGRYRGTTGQSGHDGLWFSPNGQKILIEVKTTSVYQIKLNTIAGYRDLLIKENKLSKEFSSILIVVGNEDTSDLEAQIRGSKLAWDIRLVSVDALLKLLKLRENTEEVDFTNKVCDVLRPQEYTRIDGIINLVFSTVESAAPELEEDEEDEITDPNDEAKKPKFVPVKFHDACAVQVADTLKVPLIKRTKASWASPDGTTVLICIVSRPRAVSAGTQYWFAFHPHQHEVLNKSKQSYITFGCGSASKVLLIPFAIFSSWLEGLNKTKIDDRFYWHIHILEQGGRYTLLRKKGYEHVDISKFKVDAKNHKA